MRRQSAPRRGVAAVEMGWTFMVFVVPLLIGIWEIGRLVQVQQIVSNSAREGARLAAQGYTINSNGDPTQIKVKTGTPSVRGAVYQHLVGAGLTGLTLTDDPATTDVKVDFQFIDDSGNPTSPTEPFEGAKNQRFKVTVSVRWEKVRWVNLGIIRPDWVTFTVTWRMLVDDKFSVNETLPSF